jgi:hypothetical protein
VKKLLVLLPLIILLSLVLASPALAADHKGLNGCQAEGTTYWINVGPPGGMPFGPCCIRGWYDGPNPGTENGFPGGCCKNNETHDQSPGAPENPGPGVWQNVGWQCECPDIRGF